MKNLSKELLVNELIVKMKVLKEINQKIEEKKITNQAHKLYTWKNMSLGAIAQLKDLIKTINTIEEQE